MIDVRNQGLTIEELSAIPCNRPPDAGNRWAGIEHGELIRLINAEFASRVWPVANPQYAIYNGGTDMVASFELGIPSKQDCIFVPSLGVLTSNAGNRAMQFFVGGAHYDGWGYYLNTVSNNRHVKTASIATYIAYACDSLSMCRVDTALDIDKNEVSVDGPQYNKLLHTVAREGVLPWSRIGRVDTVFRAANKQTEYTLLRLLCTQVRRGPPIHQLPRLRAVWRLLRGI